MLNACWMISTGQTLSVLICPSLKGERQSHLYCSSLEIDVNWPEGGQGPRETLLLSLWDVGQVDRQADQGCQVTEGLGHCSAAPGCVDLSKSLYLSGLRFLICKLGPW